MAEVISYDEFVRQMFIDKVDEWLGKGVTILPFPTFVLQYEDWLKEKYKEYIEESVE
tara:strand:+ start:918 stop:1088 length:171 start_codon:yes stop_codon:yes gene_type:complete